MATQFVGQIVRIGNVSTSDPKTDFRESLLCLAEQAESEGCQSVADALLSMIGTLDESGRYHPDYLIPHSNLDYLKGLAYQLRRVRERGSK